MNIPLGVSPSKGKQGTTSDGRSKQSDGRSKPEVVGSIPTEVKRFFSLPRVVPCLSLLGLTPSGIFMGLLAL